MEVLTGDVVKRDERAAEGDMGVAGDGDSADREVAGTDRGAVEAEELLKPIIENASASDILVVVYLAGDSPVCKTSLAFCEFVATSRLGAGRIRAISRSS